MPRKNVRPFKGMPMLHWPILAAQRSKLFAEVVVSTDDDEIEHQATIAETHIHRRRLDDGSRGTQEIARDVLMDWPDATHACVIYPCSPLLVPSDFERGWAVLQKPGALYAMSVQTDPLADAGCFYWGLAEAFRVRAPLIDSHTVMVPMPSNRVCDINTPEDWARAESMFDALRRAA